MKNNLLFIRDSIRSLDADPNLSIRVWNTPNMKQNCISEMINASIIVAQRGFQNVEGFKSLAEIDEAVRNRPENETEARAIFAYINSKDWEQYCWRLHDVHFHTDFWQFVKCPYTCLAEIDECLSKIIKENYNA